MLDIDGSGVIQGYQVCNNLQDDRLQDPSLERLFCGKQLFNCPSCTDPMELILFISNLSTEVLSELADNEVSDIISTKWASTLEGNDQFEELEVEDDFNLGDESDLGSISRAECIDTHFDAQDYAEEIELKTDTTDPNKVNTKTHYRAVRIAKEQSALANEEFKCDNCQECFMYKVALMNHQKKCLNKDLNVVFRVERESNFDCPKCEQKFKSRAGMVIHERTCRGERVPFCVECNTEYRSQLALNKHIRAVHQPTFYHCEECGDS